MKTELNFTLKDTLVNKLALVADEGIIEDSFLEKTDSDIYHYINTLLTLYTGLSFYKVEDKLNQLMPDKLKGYKLESKNFVIDTVDYKDRQKGTLVYTNGTSYIKITIYIDCLKRYTENTWEPEKNYYSLMPYIYIDSCYTYNTKEDYDNHIRSSVKKSSFESLEQLLLEKVEYKLEDGVSEDEAIKNIFDMCTAKGGKMLTAIDRTTHGNLEGLKYSDHKYYTGYNSVASAICRNASNCYYIYENKQQPLVCVLYVRLSCDYSMQGNVMVGNVYFELVDYKFADHL